ncbi:MAG: aldo/keto reductase [Planctomycetota bacterium]|jgi:aryl-alcohol dehydrogenase-like predicted oxidoreductase
MFDGIPVGLGAAGFGTSVTEDESFSIMDAYASLGGRILDTANNYASWHPGASGGESERVIGKWLKQRTRSDFTILTKIGSFQIDGKPEGLSSEAVHHAVAQCLERLETDYIDILLGHHDDHDTPLEETWTAFSGQVSSGMVKHIGVSNYSSERIRELAEIIREKSLEPVSYIQLQYSEIEDSNNTTPWAVNLDQEMKGILEDYLPETQIMVYSPLKRGVFEKDPAGELPQEYDSPQNREKISVIQKQAKENGISPSACVLMNLVSQGIIPITATSKIERLKSNLQFLS